LAELAEKTIFLRISKFIERSEKCLKILEKITKCQIQNSLYNLEDQLRIYIQTVSFSLFTSPTELFDE
jgi:hypothetical protein